MVSSKTIEAANEKIRELKLFHNAFYNENSQKILSVIPCNIMLIPKETDLGMDVVRTNINKLERVNIIQVINGHVRLKKNWRRKILL